MECVEGEPVSMNAPLYTPHTPVRSYTPDMIWAGSGRAVRWLRRAGCAGTGRWLPRAGGMILVVFLAAALAGGCGLFEPRDPEEPNQSSLNFRPPTDPDIVITNLRSAIEQKSVANYTACFADASRGAPPFVFIPSADAAAIYGATLGSWTLQEEQEYFQNIIARSNQQANATLALTLKTTTVSSDSVVSAYDYVLVFEHNDTGFPKTARGSLQLTLREDASNFWMIQRWVDFKTTDDISWSHFKGRFSD
jgi:stringent starvation protein B